jgi:hypothetical protein
VFAYTIKLHPFAEYETTIYDWPTHYKRRTDKAILSYYLLLFLKVTANLLGYLPMLPFLRRLNESV